MIDSHAGPVRSPSVKSPWQPKRTVEKSLEGSRQAGPAQISDAADSTDRTRLRPEQQVGSTPGELVQGHRGIFLGAIETDPGSE